MPQQPVSKPCSAARVSPIEPSVNFRIHPTGPGVGRLNEH
jgi:hypothetical protein